MRARPATSVHPRDPEAGVPTTRWAARALAPSSARCWSSTGTRAQPAVMQTRFRRRSSSRYITIPLFAMLRGNRCAHAPAFIGDVDIVDGWQPYFCVSTNLFEVGSTAISRSCGVRCSPAFAPGTLPRFVASDGMSRRRLDNLPVVIIKALIGGNVMPWRSVRTNTRSTRKLSVAASNVRSRWTRQTSAVFSELPILDQITLLGGMRGRGELQEDTVCTQSTGSRFRFLSGRHLRNCRGRNAILRTACAMIDITRCARRDESLEFGGLLAVTPLGPQVRTQLTKFLSSCGAA